MLLLAATVESNLENCVRFIFICGWIFLLELTKTLGAVHFVTLEFLTNLNPLVEALDRNFENIAMTIYWQQPSSTN